MDGREVGGQADYKVLSCFLWSGFVIVKKYVESFFHHYGAAAHYA